MAQRIEPRDSVVVVQGEGPGDAGYYGREPRPEGFMAKARCQLSRICTSVADLRRICGSADLQVCGSFGFRRLRTADCGLRNCGIRVADIGCRLRTAQLRDSGCGYRPCALWTALPHCGLAISERWVALGAAGCGQNPQPRTQNPLFTQWVTHPVPSGNRNPIAPSARRWWRTRRRPLKRTGGRYSACIRTDTEGKMQHAAGGKRSRRSSDQAIVCAVMASIYITLFTFTQVSDGNMC